MDLLKERFFKTGSHDSQLECHKIDYLPCIQEKAPAFNYHSIQTAFRKASRKKALLHNFHQVTGGTEVHCKSRGALYLDGTTLTAVFIMEPAADGYEVFGLKDCDSFPTVKMAFDFQHDHYNGVLFEFQRHTKPKANTILGAAGVLASDNQYKILDPVTSGWKVQQKDLKKKWTIALSLDLKKFRLNPKVQPTIGFCFVRHQVVMGHIETYTWPYSRSHPVPPPLFGTLSLIPSPIQPMGIDFRNPIHGKNDSAILLKNNSKKSLKVICHSKTNAPNLKVQYKKEVMIEPGLEKKVPLIYECSVIDYRDQWITFEIEAENKRVYRSKFLAGSFYAIMYGGSFLQLKHRFHAKFIKNANHPEKGDPDFFIKKRNYILYKLPDYHRDPHKPFQYINAYKRKKRLLRFDLNDQRIFQKMARHIDQLFEEDDDRIIAAMYLIHQSNTWSGAFSTVTSCSDARTMLTLGYNLCGSFAIMLSALLSCMTERKTGRFFSAHYANGYRHVICAVGRGRDHILLDPNLGYFFPNPKTGRLATFSEIKKDHSLVETVLPGRRDDYLLHPEKMFGARTMSPLGGPAYRF